MTDNEILHYFLWGYEDGLQNIETAVFNDKLANSAYIFGYVYSENGPDVEFPPNEVLLEAIKFM